MKVELEPHQLKAIEEIHNGCILKGGVGVGKSRTAIGYFYTKIAGGSIRTDHGGDFTVPQRTVNLYIITTAKKRDKGEWEEEAAHFGLVHDSDLSYAGIKVTVDSWNNILDYKDVKDAFFIFDEQRVVGAGAWVKAFYEIAKRNQWIVLSATPGDNWMDYIPILVANGHYKNRTEFIRRHVKYNNHSPYPKVDRYLETNHLDRIRRSLLVDMPYPRHTVRHIRNILVGHNVEAFRKVWEDRWHIYEDRPIRDIGELFRVARRLVNSDPSRLGAVMELLESHPRVIIFYEHNYELDALRVLSQTLGIEFGEWNGHKHQEIPETTQWIYLVQYTAGAEGWNCIATDAMIFFGLNYSWKKREQGRGRIDRLNTPFIDLYYYDLYSSSRVDQLIMKALAEKGEFNERAALAKSERRF